jgi:hypothetical protein
MALKQVALKGEPIINEDGAASEAITPGMLVAGVTSIAKFSTAGGPAPRNFALERDELGNDIDVDYASGDYVKIGSFRPGDHVYALIASGQDISADEWLEPADDGTVRAYASGTRIGRSLTEAGAVTALTRIIVEVY